MIKRLNCTGKRYYIFMVLTIAVATFYVALMCNCLLYTSAEANAPHEANFLKLDCSKLKTTFGWTPRWHMAECMEKTVAFSKIWLANGDVPAEMEKEINIFLEEQ